MMNRESLSVLTYLLPIATAVSLLGCGGQDREAAEQTAAGAERLAAAGQPAAGAPNAVRVLAKDFGFDGPSEVPAGLTTFTLVNQGLHPHHLMLIRLDEGKTMADFAASMQAGGQPPTWLRMMGGPNAVGPGDQSNATLDLEPGHYAFICVIPDEHGVPHAAQGMVLPFEVTGTPRSVPAPKADVIMTLVDYGFQTSTPITAGTHTIQVDNKGPQPHEVVIARLEDGKTLADLMAWFQSGETPEALPTTPPPAHFMGGIAPMEAGQTEYFTADFQSGDYVLLCFVPDAKDGKPHSEHGMVQEFKVS